MAIKERVKKMSHYKPPLEKALTTIYLLNFKSKVCLKS